MTRMQKIPERVLGLVGIALFLLLAALVGEVYRKFQLLWVFLWLSIPVLAYTVRSGIINEHVTEKGLRALRVWLMIFAVGMSFIIFMDNELKAKFGHYFFKGSTFWVSDYGDTDDSGNPVVSHDFSAPTAWGRFVLRAYDWVIMVLCGLLPYLLFHSFERPLRAKEDERYRQERLVTSK